MKKRLKGLGALALVFTMVLSMFAMTVQADTPSWDTSWYNGTDTVYTISTPAQFEGLFHLSASREVSVKLANDLDFTGYPWSGTHVGYDITIYGDGHVISGICGDYLFSNYATVNLFNVGLEDVVLQRVFEFDIDCGTSLYLMNAYMVGEFQKDTNVGISFDAMVRDIELIQGYIYDTGLEKGFLNVNTDTARTMFPVTGAQLRGAEPMSGDAYEDRLKDISDGSKSFGLPVPEIKTARDLLDAWATLINEYEAAYQVGTPFSLPWYSSSNLNHGFPQFKNQQSDGIPSWIFGGSGAGSNPFTDVLEGSWFADAVIDMNARGIMTGTAPDTFSSETAVTRAQLVTALWRLEGQPMGVEHAGFPDVDMDSWYGYAVDWAAAFDIVEGYDGLFHPEAPVTREQMAAILYRYTQYVGGDMLGAADLSGYTDAGDISDYAAAAMQWAVAQGLMEGSNFELSPKGTLTRAQMAVILSRYLSK